MIMLNSQPRLLKGIMLFLCIYGCGGVQVPGQNSDEVQVSPFLTGLSHA